eukprot:1233041-Pleurochrysis_carterae.AAC.1
MQSVANADLAHISDIIDMQTAVWRSTDHFRTIGLPETYPECYALAIYVYTLESPSLYAAVNKEMAMPLTRQAASGA